MLCLCALCVFFALNSTHSIFSHSFQANQEVSVLHASTSITVVINDGPTKTTKKLIWAPAGRPIHSVGHLTPKALFLKKCKCSSASLPMLFRFCSPRFCSPRCVQVRGFPWKTDFGSTCRSIILWIWWLWFQSQEYTVSRCIAENSTQKANYGRNQILCSSAARMCFTLIISLFFLLLLTVESKPNSPIPLSASASGYNWSRTEKKSQHSYHVMVVWITLRKTTRSWLLVSVVKVTPSVIFPESDSR